MSNLDQAVLELSKESLGLIAKFLIVKEENNALREQVHALEESKKTMFDEIREKINNLTEYKTFVRVEGDPVPTLPQIAKWCVIWILDEMEAKL